MLLIVPYGKAGTLWPFYSCPFCSRGRQALTSPTRSTTHTSRLLYGTQAILVTLAFVFNQMSATTASSFLSSRPTPHSKYYSSSSSSSDGPVSTDRDHTGSSSPHFHKTFQPHVLFRWTKPGKAVSVVGSWNGYVLVICATALAFGRLPLLLRIFCMSVYSLA